MAFRFSPRLHPLVLAAALGVSLPLAAAGARAQGNDDPREAPEVHRLVLSGVKAVDEDELEESISTDASGCRSLLMKPFCLVTKSKYFYEREYLDRREMRLDVLRIKVFYWKRGYREAEVDTTVTALGDEKVEVRFDIREGPPTVIRALRVAPEDGPLSERDRRRLVSLRVGQPLNLLALDSSRVRLRTVLWDRGYGDAEVQVETRVVDSLRAAVVLLAADPKARTTVGTISLSGNDEISPRTIRNSLTFRPGDLYRRSEVLRSQRNLYESGLFKRAAIDTVNEAETGSVAADSAAARTALAGDSASAQAVVDHDSVKAIVVRVEEAPLREARVSTGFNTVDFVQTEGRFSHYNFLGRARRLDVQGAIGNLLAAQLNGRGVFRDVLANEDDRSRFLAPTWQASVGLRQRWFGSPQNTIAGNVFAHRRSAPGVFVDRGVGASATFTREVAERTPVSATYRFEVTRVEAGDIYFCVNYGVCELETVGALRDRQRLSPVALTASVNRTNDPLSPSRGYIANATLEHASTFTASDFRYNRAFLEGAYYFRMGRGSVIATRVRAGWVNALESTQQATGAAALHPRKRFYAGGSQSVRGFGENQLGPRVLTISSQKLRGGAGEYCGAEVPIARCDPNAFFYTYGVDENGNPDSSRTALPSEAFVPRPTGGSRLLEGSVEYRFPLWGDKLFGATFVDAGVVSGAAVGQGEGEEGIDISEFVRGDAAVTPGVGIRYRSPIGHIRVDVGYRPRTVEELSVITDDNSSGRTRLVLLEDPDGVAGPRSGKRRIVIGEKFLDRLTLHLSIGEAF